MDTINFDLSKTIFKNDLVYYKKRSMSLLYKLFNCRNKSLYKSKTAGYHSCADRPFPFNDKYNQIILALRYNRHPDTIHESNLNTCSLDTKYHQFLYTTLMLPLEIREALEEIVSDYTEVKERGDYEPSYKKPVLLGRRKIEKQLSYYIENRLIEINTYYQTLLIDFDPIKNQKEKIQKKGNEEWVCQCGYKGLYNHSSRHLKTALHTKKLQAVLDQSR